jgi:hypothetical protein
LQINPIVKSLQANRPIFHSEADFQHALAWEIHLENPLAHVRLEVGHKGCAGPTERIDIVVTSEGTTLAIELKYKKKKFDGVVGGEEFHLTQQSSTDTAQFDYVRDICRLERFVKANPASVGYAMLLTNEDFYWKCPQRPNSNANDAEFRIYEGCILKGVVGWKEKAAAGTKGKHASPLILTGSHSMQWADYSEIEGKGARVLRYVLVEIKP